MWDPKPKVRNPAAPGDPRPRRNPERWLRGPNELQRASVPPPPVPRDKENSAAPASSPSRAVRENPTPRAPVLERLAKAFALARLHKYSVNFARQMRAKVTPLNRPISMNNNHTASIDSYTEFWRFYLREHA